MKSILFAVMATFAINVFAQSYLIMENGIVVTTDSSGFTYDFGHYAFPQKVTLKGGQYFVEEGNILATVDENGFLFRKYELIPENIKGKGINYFISEEGFAYTIDKKGFVKVTESEIYTNALNFGGNYFTVAVDTEKSMVDLYVVTAEGLIQKADIPTLKVKDIVAYGGTYFMNNRGVIHTISSSGVVSGKDQLRIGLLQRRGGNFFVDSSGFFFSVSESGELLTPPLPVTLRPSSVQRLGTNYFIDQAGKFFVVDRNGNVFERIMRDHDFRLAKIISL